MTLIYLIETLVRGNHEYGIDCHYDKTRAKVDIKSTEIKEVLFQGQLKDGVESAIYTNYKGE